MKQQTAVQWILEQMPELNDSYIAEMALLIEKQQINNAYTTGLLQFSRDYEDIEINEYYERTYGKGEGTN